MAQTYNDYYKYLKRYFFLVFINTGKIVFFYERFVNEKRATVFL